MRIFSSSSYIIFFFLFLLTTSSSYIDSTLTFVPGMRSIKVSSSTLQQPPPQVVEEAAAITNQGKIVENEDNIDTEELAYHTDYHGVSTHPTPNPKHPTP